MNGLELFGVLLIIFGGMGMFVMWKGRRPDCTVVRSVSPKK